MTFENAMPTTPVLSLIRELASCYQAFEAYSLQQIRGFGLTACQFDIIATLGNTSGLSFRDLGSRTLITKGTLTGVVDRLTEKGLVRRIADPDDGRSQIVMLTEQGEALFADIFPRHVQYLNEALATLSAEEIGQMQLMLQRLGSVFTDKKETA